MKIIDLNLARRVRRALKKNDQAFIMLYSRINGRYKNYIPANSKMPRKLPARLCVYK